MTYCLAVSVRDGIVFTSDSRTNAGVDHVNTYSKMFIFDGGEARQLVLLSAGNLATTQGVVQQLRRDIREKAAESLMTAQDMSEAADYVGSINIAQQQKLTGGGATFEASFILGGQIRGEGAALCRIYPEGNHITVSRDTPYLQIGEHKYGKPILDRIITFDTPLDTAAVCSLVSMDSTVRSNLTVGPPFEMLLYHAGTFRLERRWKLDQDTEYLTRLRQAWDEEIKTAFARLPSLPPPGDG